MADEEGEGALAWKLHLLSGEGGGKAKRGPSAWLSIAYIVVLHTYSNMARKRYYFLYTFSLSGKTGQVR